MKKIQNKKLRRKNPSYRDLQDLVNKKVIVRIKSELGFYSLNGILEKNEHLYTVSVVGPDTTLYQGYVTFNIYMIEKIINNIIELKSNQEKSPTYTNLKDIVKLVNEYVYVRVNSKFYQENVSTLPPTINGKLKYNSKQKLFYIQNKNFEIQLSFKFEALEAVSDFARIISIVI